MDSIEEEPHPAVRELFENRSEMHPALSEWHEPGADTWVPLWDWVFANDIFRSWQRDDNSWILRCVGRPGSGKTTLSAVVAKQLRERYHGDKEAVASVFVRTDVVSGGTAFVEDVLTSIFHQLCVNHTEVDVDEAYVAKYRLYLDARRHGHRDIFRIKLMRDALQSRLGMLDRAFLLVDDFDRCSPAVDLFLENELAILANTTPLKIMITSRISCLKAIPTWQYCDFCNPEQLPSKFLHVYWRCEGCRGNKVKLAYILCQDCRDKGKICANCGDAVNFVQPFDHVELAVDSATEPVAQFIDWDLQTEHGNLGLGSDSASRPPPSAFGRRLAESRNREALTSLREQIRSQASGNISLARLRLDNVHQTQSIDSVSSMADVLPANIVAFFDAGIQRVEEQTPSQRDLGLKAIAAVTHFAYSEGVEYEVLERILRRAAKTSARAHAKRTTSAPTITTRSKAAMRTTAEAVHVPHRSLEEILHAARGFLVVGNLKHRPLVAYCQSFQTYSREHYNESLVWAHAQLDFEGEGLAEFGSKGTRRSQTGVAHFVEKRDQAMTQRPLLQERELNDGRGDGDRGAGEIGDGLTHGGTGPPDSACPVSASLGTHGETPKRSAAAARKKTDKATDFERDPSFRVVRRGTSWA